MSPLPPLILLFSLLHSFLSGSHGSSGGGATEGTDRGTFEVNGVELDREESRKARVLYDYDAESENELTIYADQVSQVSTAWKVQNISCVCTLVS